MYRKVIINSKTVCDKIIAFNSEKAFVSSVTNKAFTLGKIAPPATINNPARAPVNLLAAL